MRPLVYHEPWAGIAFFATFAVWAIGELVLQVRTSTDESDRSRIWMIAGSVAGLVVAFAAAGADPHLPGPGWLPVAVGLALMVAGMALRAWSVRTLGRFFTVTVDVTDDQRVVDSGPYALLRHPSYTGMLIVYLGIGAALDSWITLIATPVPLLLAILERIGHEERMLHQGLGPAYAAYARRTKRLVPLLW
ncbi:MAG TPA: isoprenylcysteine carboxylmethyltransferase family protein [Thermoleophilaceae bacterium]|nr:isoprenylcysteine carboxylmethyltransferase family protein [Thermoleophilaceae bacterium]